MGAGLRRLGGEEELRKGAQIDAKLDGMGFRQFDIGSGVNTSATVPRRFSATFLSRNTLVAVQADWPSGR